MRRRPSVCRSRAWAIPTAEVAVGDILLVRPGSKIAVDGEVVDGESEVDEWTVTGESLPVHKAPGTAVIGATISKNRTLRVRATKVGADTALAQIVKLVRQAQNSRPASGAPAAIAMLFAIAVVVITCPDVLGHRRLDASHARGYRPGSSGCRSHHPATARRLGGRARNEPGTGGLPGSPPGHRIPHMDRE